MEAAVEISAVSKLRVSDLPHARHDPHAEDDIDGVGQFEADLRQRRTGRAHEIWDNVHGAPMHAAARETVKFLVHFAGWRPIVGGAGLLLRLRADVSALLDAGDVVWI